MEKPTELTTDNGPEPAAPSWRDAWQVPSLVASGLLLVGAAAVAFFSRPEPDIPALLDQAERLVESGEYRTALDVLNRGVLPHHGSPKLDEAAVKEFHLLRARALYLGQKSEGLDAELNHRNVLNEYAAALGDAPVGSLDGRDLHHVADTHISLDQIGPAMEVLRQIPVEESERRSELLRRMMARKAELSGGKPEAALALLSEVLADERLDESSRAWGLARMAELLIRQGRAAEAVDRLLRNVPRLTRLEPATMGELLLLLGRAYFEVGGLADASRQIERAAELLPAGSRHRGQLAIMEAKLLESAGDVGEAKEKYAGVLADPATADVHAAAMLGLAESHAALGELDEAVAAYADLVRDLKSLPADAEVGPGRVEASLLARFEDSVARREPVRALRFAELAGQVRGLDAAPSDVVLAQARAHRMVADELLAPALAAEDRLAALAGMERERREEAKRHLRLSGERYEQHAERMAGTDAAAYADSLWAAAEAFDLAGDHGSSVATLSRYVQDFPGDARHAEARFRLGRAQQARGDYAAAASLFRALIENDGMEKGVGPFADASYVPLAQVYLADEEPANDAEARRLLNLVVDGRIGGTASEGFRDALRELARVHLRAGEHAAAIERLEELRRRFPEGPDRTGVRYDLAEAYRLDAASMARTLESAMPDHERRALEEARTARLRRASELYESVRAELDGRGDGSALSELERTRLRNSVFYLGDCAFDLGEYETARRLYDTARERYPDDPASLVAMIQIVNAYLEEGDHARAATANERARRFYESLPESVWDDPDLPMDRGDWQRWLDSIAALVPRPAAGRADAADAENEP